MSLERIGNTDTIRAIQARIASIQRRYAEDPEFRARIDARNAACDAADAQMGPARPQGTTQEKHSRPAMRRRQLDEE